MVRCGQTLYGRRFSDIGGTSHSPSAARRVSPVSSADGWPSGSQWRTDVLDALERLAVAGETPEGA